MDLLDKGRRAEYADRLACVAVWFITLAFGVTAALLLRAKWMNLDPFLVDFAITARFYEKILNGIPFHYTTHYYTPIYMPLHLLVLPLYALLSSVALVFAVHIFSFTLAIPLLYGIGRQVLPGVVLPLVVVVAYVLNPSINITTLTFLRQEALWMLLFLLTVYLQLKRAHRLAVYCALAACVVRIDAAPAIFLLGLMYRLQGRAHLGAGLMKGSSIIIGIMLAGMIVFRVFTGISPDLQQLHMCAIINDPDPSAWSTFWRSLRAVTDLQSYKHLLILFQFLLLPLLAPLHLLPGLASVLYVVLSSESWLAIPLVASLLTPGGAFVPSLHIHDAYLLPILFVAMIYGMRRLYGSVVERMGLGERARSVFRKTMAGVLCVLFFGVHWFFASPALGPIPLTQHFDCAYYRQTPRARVAWEVLERIPTDEAGLVQFTLAERVTALPHIQEVYPFTEVLDEHQYAFFDLYAMSPNMPKRELLEKIEAILRREDFRVEVFEEGILLLRKGPADEGNETVLRFIDENMTIVSRERPWR